ncbi:bifunctional cytidylyltransferase/SDR family oxidoreductase [Candidatus Sororendozoicomonas aggregata]|uniref:bifunctional cytidylyltransferase/SDR family oxidoreductase n=1 Tax=Candidatus Sororendozoicomonas aggregata TaxID=3073239 RepID=UPI002ED0487C
MKNIAVILASGSGKRFGSSTPKQFIKLAGKPVIQYTIETFNNHKLIDEVVIVTIPEYISKVEDMVLSESFNKVTKVINGGKERFDSSWSAIQSINEQECNVLFHDSVRPFLDDRIINECIKELNSYNAVDVVVAANDTIVKIRNDEIMSIPNRQSLRRGQTPQAFKLSTIRNAYDLFMKDTDQIASDDCGIVLKYLPNEPIGIVNGDEKNFKITHSQDIFLANSILKYHYYGIKKTASEKIENTLTDKTIVIFGGSSGIGQAILTLCRDYGANVFQYSRSNGCDISNYDEVEKTLESLYEKEQSIDFVINTAGILIKKTLQQTSQEEISSLIGINYLGALNVAKASFKYLKKSQGMLINYTSSSYTRGRAFYSIYSSTKAAIVNLTQALSEEWHPFNIKVNCINPERTKTPMRTKNFGIEPDDTLLSPKQVAQYTISTMCNDITGQIITVKKI